MNYYYSSMAGSTSGETPHPARDGWRERPSRSTFPEFWVRWPHRGPEIGLPAGEGKQSYWGPPEVLSLLA